MKYVCVGAGATGAITGAFPAIAGQDVWYIDPYKEHVEAIDKNGLEIRMSTFEKPDDKRIFNVKIHGRTEAEGVGIADVVILMTKSCYTRSAIDTMRAVIDDHTIIITLQNGLGNVELLSEYFDRGRIVYGYTTISSVVVSPGVIAPRMPSYHHIVLGCDNACLRRDLEPVIADYKAGGCDIIVDDNIQQAIWEKAAMNCGGNGISALLRLTARDCFAYEEYMQEYSAIIDEVDAVAKAKGINLDQSIIHRYGASAHPLETSAIPDTPCSMAQDVCSERLTEIEFLNGAVVKEAKKLGIPVPKNELVYHIVSVLEKTYDKRL